jgi:hypothetical protein
MLSTLPLLLTNPPLDAADVIVDKGLAEAAVERFQPSYWRAGTHNPSRWSLNALISRT